MKRLLSGFIIASAAGFALCSWLVLSETLRLRGIAADKRGRGAAGRVGRSRTDRPRQVILGKQIGASAARRLRAEEMRQQPAEGRN